MAEELPTGCAKESTPDASRLGMLADFAVTAESGNANAHLTASRGTSSTFKAAALAD